APFLGDTIGVTQIEGTGTLTLDLTARGQSADAVMHSLGGAGTIAFRDGRLKGVDLGGVARSIATFLDGSAGPDKLTAYTTMDGHFTLANGVLDAEDFRLAGPLIVTTGSGKVDIGGRAIDFKIVPPVNAEIATKKLPIGAPSRIQGASRP